MTAIEKRAALDRLRRDTLTIAKRFGLTGCSVRLCCSPSECSRCDLGPEPDAVATCWGCCDGFPGQFRIRIRVFNRRNGRPLQWPNVVDTLCHELAHAVTYHEEDDHGPEWKREHARMLGFATAEEIYDIGADR